ncbi:MAG: WXG100 family type VII secretion target [Nocardioides sp.]
MSNTSAAGAPPGSLSQAEGALARAADYVGQARTDLLGLSDQLTGQLAALRGQWVGAGSAAFGQVHTAWQDRQRRIVGALDGLAAAIVETDHTITAADLTQSDTLTRTAARLGGC